MPFQPSPCMVGSALYDWKHGQQRDLDFQTSEVILIHPGDTKDKLTQNSTYEP